MNLFGDIHRVGSRLLLDNDHTAFLAVIVSLLGTLFDAVLDAGNVAEVNGLVILMADHKIVHLVRIRVRGAHRHSNRYPRYRPACSGFPVR